MKPPGSILKSELPPRRVSIELPDIYSDLNVHCFELQENTMKVLALCAIGSCVAFAALAEQADPVTLLTRELKSQ